VRFWLVDQSNSIKERVQVGMVFAAVLQMIVPMTLRKASLAFRKYIQGSSECMPEESILPSSVSFQELADQPQFLEKSEAKRIGMDAE
jgi:hypothetical protein